MDRYVKANGILSMFSKGYMELKKDLPIRPSEMAVLNIIVQRDGKYTPLMIAELLAVSKPMITALITALGKKGYITKEHLTEDKRSFYVVPTSKAKKLVLATAETTKRNLQCLENELGEDYERLLEILENTNKILMNLKGDRL